MHFHFAECGDRHGDECAHRRYLYVRAILTIIWAVVVNNCKSLLLRRKLLLVALHFNYYNANGVRSAIHTGETAWVQPQCLSNGLAGC